MKLSFGSFAFLPKNFLGIDIGTSALKVVELSRWGERRSLKNYGEIQSATLYGKPFRTFEKNTLLLSSEDIARALKAILQEAKIATREAVFSLPDFSSFFSHFQLPPMTREELPEAVQFEARRHIPLPLAEVVFDWQLIEGRPGEKTPFKILIVAVPKEVVNQYQEIASLAGILLKGLEAEVFGCIRSLVGDRKEAIVLIDMGAQSTTINVVWKKMLRISHSLDIAGTSLTERIAQSLSLDLKPAEERKLSAGLKDAQFLSILSPLIDLLLVEVQKTTHEFFLQERQEIQEVIFVGGSALLPGLKEYAAKFLGKPVEVGNPFFHLFYPPILEETLKQTGPSYAVAVGAALRGLE